MNSNRLFSYERIYALAHEWLECNKGQLVRDNPGKHIFINAGNLTYVIGENYNKNAEEYVRQHGPTPTGGRSILALQL